MPKLSQLQLPREGSFMLRGEKVAFKYNAAVLTDAYIDEYDDYVRSMTAEGKKSSEKLAKMRANVAHQVIWLDVQDDAGLDIPVADVLAIMDWTEVQDLGAAVSDDIALRNNPTPPSAGASSSG